MSIAGLKISFIIFYCISLSFTNLNAQQKTPNAFYFASEIAADSRGNLFVIGKGNRIIKITPDGSAYHFAGHPKGFTQSKDGKGAEAMFAGTAGITIDEDDNLFIADYTTIRRVSPEGQVKTICGNPTISFVKDDNIKTTTFKRLGAIAVDKKGILYVTDQYYDSAEKRTNQIIRKIGPDEVTTIKNNDGRIFSCHYIRGLVCDKQGNLYVSAGAWSSAIIKITPDGMHSTIAGVYDSNKKNMAKFREGEVNSARFLSPWGIAINKKGEIYFSDSWVHRIIKIDNNQLTVVAGGGGKSASGHSIMNGSGQGGLADGRGTQALFSNPHGISFDKEGNLFIVDGSNSNNYIRKLSVNGMVSTFCKQEYNPVTKQYEQLERSTSSLVVDKQIGQPETKNEILSSEIKNQVDEMTVKANRFADSVLQNGNSIPNAGVVKEDIKLPAYDAARARSMPKKTYSIKEINSYINQIHTQLSKLLPADAVSSANAIAKQLDNDPGKMEATAIVAWESGAWEEAVLLITNAASRTGNEIVLSNAGAILDMTGLSDKAIPVLKTVAQIHPQNAIAHNNLGQAFTSLGMQDSAKHYFSKCLSLSPQHPEANNTAGYLELQKGNKEKAQTFFENSIRGSFNIKAYNGVLSIKKDYKITKLVSPKVKIPEYFNQFKYKLPRQCTRVEIAEEAKKEHLDFKKMINDAVEKYSAFKKEAELKFASQGVEQIKKKVLSGKKVLRPFQAMAYQMGLETTQSYAQDIRDLDEFNKDNKRQYDLIEKEYREEYVNVMKEFGSSPECCGEGNTSCCVETEAVCSALAKLKNKYLPQFAQLVEEKQIRYLNVERKYFDDLVYWNFLSATDNDDARRRFYDLVINHLRVLEKLCYTKILEPCKPVELKLQKYGDREITEIPEILCPISFSMRFWIGKLDGDCEKISFKAGEGIKFRYERNFVLKQHTISMGVGADIDKYEIKEAGIEAGAEFEATGSVYLTFDQQGNPTDGGLLGKLKAKVGVGFESGQKLKFSEGLSVQAGISSGLSFDPGPLKPLWDKIWEQEKPINKNVKIYKEN
ncbi:MAG: NHL domain-containing protein [Flavisolibacter sp.]